MKTKLAILYALIVSVPALSAPPSVSKYIVTDQFGYLCDATKIAVIRDPVTGYDGAESFSPSASFQLRNWNTDAIVYTANIAAWNGGAEDPTSGDKAWWFNFSSVTTPGEYYVFDPGNNVGSYKFAINDEVYNEVLKHAVRSFYYQRSGTEKLAAHAGAGWADAPCFVGSLQDKNCRLFSDRNNAATEKDLSGGWFDAGDYNKYTTFVWNVLPELLSAYEENTFVWKDDYNIPESGNGIPDLLDEIKWELDWLLKMQQSDGSVLSIVAKGITTNTTGGFNNQNLSPPSATTGQSLYGLATTDATLTTTAIFAYAAKVFRSLGNPAMTTYSNTLETAAINGWNWANANPSVKWRNNDAAYNSKGMGAGQSDKSGNVEFYKVAAACYLYALTNNNTYKTYFDANYNKVHLIQWTFAYKYESTEQDMLLYYTQLPGATTAVKNDILNRYTTSIKNSPDNLPAYNPSKEPYRAFMDDYVWGSNSFLCRQGSMFYNMLVYNQDVANHPIYLDAAADVIHKMHGVNPMQLVYLTNMGNYGADNYATELWHTWFRDGSALWDKNGVSTYGPPPGYVPGGPNQGYKLDACCTPNNCAGGWIDCNTQQTTPPLGQPQQKSYRDFNANWPWNGWEVTENGIYYQAAYIKLLSKFVGGTCGALPVNFLEFTAQVNPDNKAVLLWKTSQEKDNEYFQVEKSYNGKDFFSIGNIKPGSNPDVNSYTFTDPGSLTGYVYYRVKQVDKSGQFTFTEIKFLSGSYRNVYSLSPNPFDETLIIRSLDQTPKNLKIVLIDLTGKEVFSKSLNFYSEYPLDLSGISPGLYFITINGSDRSEIQKIFKNR